MAHKEKGQITVSDYFYSDFSLKIYWTYYLWFYKTE